MAHAPDHDLINCNSNDPVSSASVISTETWKIADATNPVSKADITLDSLSNGTVSVGGKWVYIFYGSTVTCTFLSGSASINDTSVSINVSGTASYPPDSLNNVESSPFNLTIKGSFKKGISKGTWAISFSEKGWLSMNGTFTGTRQQGEGITK